MLPPCDVIEVGPGTHHYGAAVALGSMQYWRHFECRLRNHYPAYFCLVRGNRLLGTCGFRSGKDQLFLEPYLDDSPEALVSAQFAAPVRRHEIVELGGFAVRHAALALPFMASVAPLLLQRGFSHALATATMPVRRCVASLGVPFARLAPARRERLLDDASDWGSYYSHRPAVIAGSLEAAIKSLNGADDE